MEEKRKGIFYPTWSYSNLFFQGVVQWLRFQVSRQGSRHPTSQRAISHESILVSTTPWRSPKIFVWSLRCCFSSSWTDAWFLSSPILSCPCGPKSFPPAFSGFVAGWKCRCRSRPHCNKTKLQCDASFGYHFLESPRPTCFFQPSGHQSEQFVTASNCASKCHLDRPRCRNNVCARSCTQRFCRLVLLCLRWPMLREWQKQAWHM